MGLEERVLDIVHGISIKYYLTRRRDTEGFMLKLCHVWVPVTLNLQTCNITN